MNSYGESLSGETVNRLIGKSGDDSFSKPYSLIHLFIICCLCIFAFPFSSSAEDIHESRLNKGLKNTDPYSYSLIKKAQADPSNARDILTEAIKYSPDLPEAYFKLAVASFSFSKKGLFEHIDYMLQGFEAYGRNFWWLRSIAGLSLISLIASSFITLAAVALIRFFTETPLLSHDVREDKKKALLIFGLLLFSFFGPLFFIAGAISVLGLYFRKMDKAVVYSAILFLMLSPFLLRFSNFFLSSSPELRAVVDVNEERDNRYALSALKGRNDFTSLFSYGLALKREGRYSEAIDVYKKLLSVSADPRVYINLGNCYFAMEDIVAAKDFYKKAIDTRPTASAYYNLSQLSHETLDFVGGSEYYREATKLDMQAVSEFTASTGKGPSRFVVDERLPIGSIWEYARSISGEGIKILFPGAPVFFTGGFVLLIAFFLIDNRIKYRAYRCRRCGLILCGVCSKEMLWGQMCSKCYKSLVKLDELDSRERIAKLLQVQERQARRKKMIKALSFLPPGVAYIYAGRILAGSLFLLLFLFLICLIVFNPLVSTGLSLFSHDWLNIPAIVITSALYVISILVVRGRINRWL